MAFVDHRWNSHFSSALGYSRVDIDNSNLQAGKAFRSGQYALVNLLWTPLPNVMAGGELQYAHRDNKDGAFDADDFRLQFSMRYSFSQRMTAPKSRPRAALIEHEMTAVASLHETIVQMRFVVDRYKILRRAAATRRHC